MSGKPHLRPIERRDDAAMAAIIRHVMTVFGASGPGFAIHDAEVDEMSSAYSGRGQAYFVWEEGGRVVGGAGVAPLAGGDGRTCELRKMYFLPEARGRGLGLAMLRQCLTTARLLGYSRVYLETLDEMGAARRLYEFVGFKPQRSPEGCTGHYGCNRFYALELPGVAPLV